MAWPQTSEPDELAKVIKQILTDNAIKIKLENGAADLMHNYKWTKIGMQTHDFIKNVIAKNL